MLCPISGKVPDTPVVTPQGHVYEQRLLEEYRKTHGDVDPITGESFDPEQIVVIKNGATPDASAETLPISQLLHKVQSEFDVLLLQNFKLRSALDAMKGQLSQSLYQHDAACRVVARLTRERELWKSRVAAAPASATTPADTSSAIAGFSAEKLQEISENAADLQAARKSKSLDTFANEELAAFKCVNSTVTHEAARPGVTDLAIKDQHGRGAVVLTSGEDGHITMTALSTMSRVTRFQASDSAVNCVDVHPEADVVVAGCKNKSVRFFTGASQGGEISFNLHKATRAHTEAVSSVEIHPLGDFVMSGGADNKIVFTDIESGNAMSAAILDNRGLASLRFHPDGNIFLSGGMDGTLGVWDIREMAEKIRFGAADNANLTGIQVAENGYYLSTVDTCGAMKVWDLRKFKPNDENTPITVQQIVDNVTKTPFSLSLATHNNLLAACGANSEGQGLVRIGTLAKKAKEITFGSVHDTEHKDIVTRCMFVPDKNELVTVSKDNTVSLWRQE